MRYLLRSIVVGLLMFWGGALFAEGKSPFFTCSFDNKAEVEKSGGYFSGLAKFVPGIKGQSLDLAGSYTCWFPTVTCFPKTEGTLSAWICPHWKLRDISSKPKRLFVILNDGNCHHNYFSIIGHSWGNIAKGEPYQLFMLLRKESGKESVLVLPDAHWEKDTWQNIVAVWRINTGKKDGAFKFYLNGERIGRKTDFRAYKIEIGKQLSICPDAKIDELKIWDRMLSDEEVKEVFKNEKKQ